jgi:hypothetical protein
MRQPLCLLLHLRRRVGAPEASALDPVMCNLFNSSSNEAAQWVASALLACAALHAGGRVTLLCCLLACLECCYFFTSPAATPAVHLEPVCAPTTAQRDDVLTAMAGGCYFLIN